MIRRRSVAVTTVTAASLAVAVVALTGGSAQDGAGDGDDDRADATATSTAEVVRQDLVEREELDGTLGYGDPTELTIVGDGTITELASEGSTVGRGGELAEVDGDPVLLLYGARAAWRDLHPGTTDGPDVRQLEENLVAMGYATADGVGPDDDWTPATTEAVKAWQADLGVEETGDLPLGSVVFAPVEVRIAAHLVAVGARAGSPSLKLTPTTRLVTIDLDADRQGIVEVGHEVEIELPDGSVVDGVVYAVSDVVDAPASEGGEPTVEVVVAFADPAESGTADQAPVDVNLVTVAVQGALTVPVEALLALAEGGYAVEKPDGSLVGVTVGAFADGYVEVTPTSGSLDEGDEVVIGG